MKITTMIDEYGKPYSPYMGNLVNHLPMGQLALYKLTEDLDRVEEYSKFYIEHFTIDPLTGPSGAVNSIEECIGKRELYEECLLLVEKEVEEKGLDSFIREVAEHLSSGNVLGSLSCADPPCLCKGRDGSWRRVDR